MILNFSFKNYHSFRDAQQFSFEPISGKKEFGPVRVAAVYGANASGKSNFIDALNFVSYFVRTGFAAGDAQTRIPVIPFLLDSNSINDDTEFSIDFTSGNEKYEFSFGLNKNEVTYENLVVYRSKQPSLLYDRTSVNGMQSIKFGSSFTGAKKQLWDITRKNSLFLSAAATAGSTVIQPAFKSLAYDIKPYDATRYANELTEIKKLFIKGDSSARILSQLIKFADIGIDDIDVRQAEGVFGLKEPFVDLKDIPEEARNLIEEDFKWSFSYDLFFHHKGVGDGLWFNSNQESEGTKAALAFFFVALNSLSSGSLALIDELDSSLHPTLLRDFVSLFSDLETNPKGAQLIFSTHDVTLMTRTSPMEEVLERDQVWFVEKDSEGTSQLIAAMEYSPRANENLGRNYLNGVYVPLPNPSFHQLVAQLMKEGADING